MRIILCFIVPFLFQTNIPFKPDDEFEFKLDYEFRNKPGIDRFEVDWSNTQKYSEGTLPFLTVRIKPLKLSDQEEKVKILTNLGNRIYYRKAEVNKEIEVEMGFTDDLKDHVGAYAYDIIFTSKREDVSHINLYVEEDGTFLINGVKKGKF